MGQVSQLRFVNGGWPLTPHHTPGLRLQHRDWEAGQCQQTSRGCTSSVLFHAASGSTWFQLRFLYLISFLSSLCIYRIYHLSRICHLASRISHLSHLSSLASLASPADMPFKSSYPDLDIPQTDLLSYLFGTRQPSDEPLWYNSDEPSKNLSPNQALGWIRRLGYGLGRMGLGKGDVGLIFTPNHIFVPVAYLGVVGAGCVFSGANPAYTAQGSCAAREQRVPGVLMTFQNSPISYRIRPPRLFWFTRRLWTAPSTRRPRLGSPRSAFSSSRTNSTRREKG